MAGKVFRYRLLRFSLWAIGVLLALFALQIGLLAFPGIFLRNDHRSGSVIVRYDGDPDPVVQRWVGETG